jgi:hypothetical protein
VTTGTQVRNSGSYCVFAGIVTSSTSIGSLTLLTGTPQNYTAAATTRVLITISTQHTNRLVSGILTQHTQTGTHTGITTDTLTASGTVTAASFVQTGAGSSAGWNVGLPAPNTVTYNGNRSYSMVFNASDQTGTLSPGMRLRTTRTVAAPTQCTSLNGTTQYYSKTSPAGMTFPNNWVVSAWIKLSSYPTSGGVIASRYNGTSGWLLYINPSGQVISHGNNSGSGNYKELSSYQSVPLNKWVHIATKQDMTSSTTTGGTNNYIMIDGFEVPAQANGFGTNPTSLIQAGNLEIGSTNSGTLPFPGKIAQVAIFSAHVTEATMQGYYSQGLAGTETSLISAYSFNNTINDLNTTNANNLTANGSAVATNADSPFSQQAGGVPNGTLDYGIIQSVSFSTNTTVVVQVPEGCTIPTSGGVSAVVYSSNKAPYGMPVQRGKWRITTPNKTNNNTTSNATYGAFLSGGHKLSVPVGEWRVGHDAGYNNATTTSVYFALSPTDLTGLSAAAGANATPLIVRTLASTASAYVERGHVEDDFSLVAQTTFTMYTFGATTSAGFDATVEKAELFAENAYL